jgi:hypothetical protein
MILCQKSSLFYLKTVHHLHHLREGSSHFFNCKDAMNRTSTGTTNETNKKPLKSNYNLLSGFFLPPHTLHTMYQQCREYTLRLIDLLYDNLTFCTLSVIEQIHSLRMF